MPDATEPGRGATSRAAANSATAANSAQANAPLPTPAPKQVAWQDCEVGAIFHFDMPVYQEGGRTIEAAIHRTWPPATYNPERLDTDQWLAAATALGARYAIFTATHFNGFLQWQSDVYDYGVKQTPWRGGKGDVVRDFVESCRRCGVKPGLYMSCFRNAWHGVDRYRVGYGEGGAGQAQFARTCERMVEELCSRYGELIQIWFDAGLIAPEEGGPEVLPIVDKHQPDLVFYHSPQRRDHRWIGNEHGVAGDPCWATMPGPAVSDRIHKGEPDDWRDLLEHGDPDGTHWCPAMVDTVLRDHHWFWTPDAEDTIEPLERLVSMYYTSVGRNGNLVLGLTPDPSGLIPAPDFRRCEEFGREIRRRFDRPLAETSGAGAVVELPLRCPQKIDHVVIMEDIAHGERVREYVVEAHTPGGPRQELGRGASIGHKRIHQFPSVEAARVRLRVTKSAAEPRIRRLAAYAAGPLPSG